jgi:hypothetical protein
MKDPKEEAIDLMDRINGKPIYKDDWEKTSYYAKKELKRKALICIEEKKKTLGDALPIGIEYYTRLSRLLEIEEEINKL